ncbi:PIN domain-containing protein (plasmid) [Arthrobacter sp. UC242_113]|uniref:PIN domain-containing protein n=1 Tax=Arthrobacter sp. UC242_113 TaxID=3374550 RepID=UPI00375782A2
MISMTDAEMTAEEPRKFGLFDGFEGYRTANREQVQAVLKTGLVVIDANVLLDLYRFSAQARRDLLSALKALNKRLWVPHQAIDEFWRNRDSVLRDPSGRDQLNANLDRSEVQLVESLKQWTNRRSHDPHVHAELTSIASEAFSSIRKKIVELSEEDTLSWARDTSSDPVLKELDSLLAGRVGSPLSKKDYEAAITEARRRADKKIPPGYMDAKKGDELAAGDYLVWEQTLLEASDRKVDVLFISRDTKEDWVRKEAGENRGPRVELARELQYRAGVSLYMKTPADFLNLAKDALDIEVHAESVTDAKRLSEELGELERQQLLASRWWKDGRGWDAEAVALFMHHLNKQHPKVALILAVAAIDDVLIDKELLELWNLTSTQKALKLVEQSIAESTEATATAGFLPAQAPAVLERAVSRAPGASPRVTGYRINSAIRELICAVSDVDEEGRLILTSIQPVGGTYDVALTNDEVTDHWLQPAIL